MSQWEPIESAPKDRNILVYVPRLGAIRWWWCPDKYAYNPRPYWTNDWERIGGIRVTRKDQPAHWMPLPEPPDD